MHGLAHRVIDDHPCRSPLCAAYHGIGRREGLWLHAWLRMPRAIWIAALAFALVILPCPALAGGWYLITAPLKFVKDRGTERETFLADWEAPLREWDLRSSHDRARECEQAKAGLVDESKRSHSYWHKTAGKNDSMTRFAVFEMVTAGQALCIASDDPRLAR